MQDLIVRRRNLEAACSEDLREMAESAREIRSADGEYRRLLAIRTTELKHEGIPVTIIDNMAKGDPEVSSARVERDFHVRMYEIQREAHLYHRMLLRNTQSDIEREWRS